MILLDERDPGGVQANLEPLQVRRQCNGKPELNQLEIAIEGGFPRLLDPICAYLKAAAQAINMEFLPQFVEQGEITMTNTVG